MGGEGTAGVPPRCTVCGTDIPPGQSRCPGCGKVFGEANRCPTCNATAAVRPRGAGFVCVACGAPRTRQPGTVVEGGGGAGLGPSALAPAAAAGGGLLRALGVLAAGAGVLVGGIGLALSGGAFGWVVSAALAGSGIAVGALLWRLGGRARVRALAAQREAGERRILAVAAERGGVLTATELAQALAMPVGAADAALTALADGTRVTVELTDDGLIEYHFRELQRGQLPRVRVATDAAGAEVEVPAGSEQAERQRGR